MGRPRAAGVAAAELAAAQLRALGVDDVEVNACAASSGHPAAGEGHETAEAHAVLTVAAAGGPLHCVIDSAGPVRLPLRSEADVQAACGLMHVHGRRHGRPTALGVDYATVSASVLAAQGVLAALLARAAGRPVRQVRTSVAQAALLTVSQYLAAATAPDPDHEGPGYGGLGFEGPGFEGPGYDGPGFEGRAAGPGAPDLTNGTGPAGPAGTAEPPFVSRDGVRFEIETFDAGGWQLFWHGLGAGATAIARGWRPFLHRYATATCPLPGELPATTRRCLYSEAMAAAYHAGIGIMPVRADSTHLRDTPPWHVTPHPPPVPHPPPHSRECGIVAARTGKFHILDAPTAGAAAGPLAAGALAALGGVVVVEVCRRLQGPLAGHILGLLGATVIRIEPPGGDPLRGLPPMAGDCSARFLAINRGKRVVELDLTSPTGRAEVLDLVAGADVFLHNLAPGKARELRLDAADLAAHRPGLVYAWASGWGDALGHAPPLGTDFMVQAYSGLGGALVTPGAPPSPSLMTLTDVLGGLVCAQGVLAALLTRARTGRGRRVDTSLLSAAALLARAPRTPRPPSAAGPDANGRPVQPTAIDHGDPPLGDDRDPLHGDDRDPRAGDDRDPRAGDDRDPRAGGGGGLPAVPVCTDLRELAADPRFAGALRHDGFAAVAAPWGFG